MPANPPKVIIYHWPSKTKKAPFGHIAIQVGNRYLSNVPVPGQIGLLARSKSRTDVDDDQLKGKSIIPEKRRSMYGRSLKADTEKFGDPKIIEVPAKNINAEAVEMAVGETLKGIRSLLTHPRPLPYFDAETLKTATFTFLPTATYQLVDSAKGANDRLNCASTTAKVLTSGISMENQEDMKLIGEQYKPDDLASTLCDVFGAQPIESSSASSPTVAGSTSSSGASSGVAASGT